MVRVAHGRPNRLSRCARDRGPRRGASDAVARVSAEMRFNSEMLEDQASHPGNAIAPAGDDRWADRRVEPRRVLASAQCEIEIGQKVGRSLVVLMIDVDHFKAINDRFGHAGGERALQQLVATLRAGIRQIDLLGRLGGEAFAIVLTETLPAPAEVVAERLRARVAEAPVSFADRLIPMTISIGLAMQLPTDASIEQIIARADDASYGAKRSGRNRVVRDQRPAAA